MPLLLNILYMYFDNGMTHHKTLPVWNNTEKSRCTSVFRMGFEPVTPIFDQIKTIYVCDHSAIQIGDK